MTGDEAITVELPLQIYETLRVAIIILSLIFSCYLVIVGFSQNQFTVPENSGENGLNIELQILDLTSEGEVDPIASLPITLQLEEAQGKTTVTM